MQESFPPFEEDAVLPSPYDDLDAVITREQHRAKPGRGVVPKIPSLSDLDEWDYHQSSETPMFHLAEVPPYGFHVEGDRRYE